jgi:tetratricopeptide (TPR) repeat protein
VARFLLFSVSILAFLLASPAAFAQNETSERRSVPDSMLSGSRTVIGTDNSFLSLGSQAMLAGRWEEGIRFTLLGLEKAGMNDRMRSGGLSNLCAGYAALNDSTQAIDYCTQSIELNEQNWRAWSNRSYAYWLKGQYELAGADLERATSINDRARQLFRIRGMLNEAGLKPRVVMEDRQ